MLNDDANVLAEITVGTFSWAFKKKYLKIIAYKEKDGKRKKIKDTLKIIVTDFHSKKILEKNDKYTNETVIPLPHFTQLYNVEVEWCEQVLTKKKILFLETELEFNFTDWAAIENESKIEREKKLNDAMRYPYVIQCSNELCTEPCIKYKVNSPTVKMVRKGRLSCKKCGHKLKLIKDGVSYH